MDNNIALKDCFKSLLSILLIAALIITAMPLNVRAEESTTQVVTTSATEEISFKDMPSKTHWSYKALSYAIENELLKGSNGYLNPGNDITRAEIATIMNRAFGAVEKADISNYTDIGKNDWYYEEMAKAVKMKTFNGTSSTTLSAGNYITRQDAFVVIARALQLKTDDFSSLSIFKDADKISDYAKEYIAALASAGYVNGSNEHINPKDNITRAEIAQVLFNIIKRYIKEPETVTEDLEGNVLVNVSGVVLKNITVKGDVIVGDGVDDGDFTLDNVKVEGRVVVRGGGDHSIKIINGSNVGNIVVSKLASGGVRVYCENGAQVSVIRVEDGSDEVKLEGSFYSVEVETDREISLANADITNLVIDAENANVNLVSGKVTEVIISEKASDANLVIAEESTVGLLVVNADSNVETNGVVQKAETKEGVVIQGEIKTSEEEQDVKQEESEPQVDPQPPYIPPTPPTPPTPPEPPVVTDATVTSLGELMEALGNSTIKDILVKGNFEITESISIDKSVVVDSVNSLTINEGAVLTILKDASLTNNGSLICSGRIDNKGSLVNKGTYTQTYSTYYPGSVYLYLDCSVSGIPAQYLHVTYDLNPSTSYYADRVEKCDPAERVRIEGISSEDYYRYIASGGRIYTKAMAYGQGGVDRFLSDTESSYDALYIEADGSSQEISVGSSIAASDITIATGTKLKLLSGVIASSSNLMLFGNLEADTESVIQTYYTCIDGGSLLSNGTFTSDYTWINGSLTGSGEYIPLYPGNSRIIALSGSTVNLAGITSVMTESVTDYYYSEEENKIHNTSDIIINHPDFITVVDNDANWAYIYGTKAFESFCSMPNKKNYSSVIVLGNEKNPDEIVVINKPIEYASLNISNAKVKFVEGASVSASNIYIQNSEVTIEQNVNVTTGYISINEGSVVNNLGKIELAEEGYQSQIYGTLVCDGTLSNPYGNTIAVYGTLSGKGVFEGKDGEIRVADGATITWPTTAKVACLNGLYDDYYGDERTHFAHSNITTGEGIQFVDNEEQQRYAHIYTQAGFEELLKSGKVSEYDNIYFCDDITIDRDFEANYLVVSDGSTLTIPSDVHVTTKQCHISLGSKLINDGTLAFKSILRIESNAEFVCNGVMKSLDNTSLSLQVWGKTSGTGMYKCNNLNFYAYDGSEINWPKGKVVRNSLSITDSYYGNGENVIQGPANIKLGEGVYFVDNEEQRRYANICTSEGFIDFLASDKQYNGVSIYCNLDINTTLHCDNVSIYDVSVTVGKDGFIICKYLDCNSGASVLNNGTIATDNITISDGSGVWGTDQGYEYDDENAKDTNFVNNGKVSISENGYLRVSGQKASLTHNSGQFEVYGWIYLSNGSKFTINTPVNAVDQNGNMFYCQNAYGVVQLSATLFTDGLFSGMPVITEESGFLKQHSYLGITSYSFEKLVAAIQSGDIVVGDSYDNRITIEEKQVISDDKAIGLNGASLSFSDVEIKAGATLTISDNISIENLTLEEGAKLIVLKGAYLDIGTGLYYDSGGVHSYGSLINNGEIVNNGSMYIYADYNYGNVNGKFVLGTIYGSGNNSVYYTIGILSKDNLNEVLSSGKRFETQEIQSIVRGVLVKTQIEYYYNYTYCGDLVISDSDDLPEVNIYLYIPKGMTVSDNAKLTIGEQGSIQSEASNTLKGDIVVKGWLSLRDVLEINTIEVYENGYLNLRGTNSFNGSIISDGSLSLSGTTNVYGTIINKNYFYVGGICYIQQEGLFENTTDGTTYINGSLIVNSGDIGTEGKLINNGMINVQSDGKLICNGLFEGDSTKIVVGQGGEISLPDND